MFVFKAAVLGAGPMRGKIAQVTASAEIPVVQIKTVSAAGELDAGIEAEKRGFANVFASEDAREGISALLQKRTARFRGA